MPPETDCHPACEHIFSCFPVLEHVCNLFIITWWDSHDHSGSGALPIGGRAQRSFTEKMNAEHEDVKFVGLRASGHTRQNSDPPPEFTGTKPSELKNYLEKVRRWLLFTRAPAQLQGPHVLSRLTGPAWDACDELEPEDVATADGVNMILDTLAEAFQDDYDEDGQHTAHVSQVKEAFIEQEEDIELEIALEAWNKKAIPIRKNPMYRRCRWSAKNHGSCEESSG